MIKTQSLVTTADKSKPKGTIAARMKAHSRKIKLAIALSVATAGLVSVAAPTFAAVTPEHAIVTCSAAGFFQNFDSATNSPSNKITTLYYGNKIGHTPGAQPVYNGWAAVFSFGRQQWGYINATCVGGYNSWP